MKYFFIFSIILHLLFLQTLKFPNSKKTYISGQNVIEIGYIQKQIINHKKYMSGSGTTPTPLLGTTRAPFIAIKKDEESKPIELRQDLNEQEDKDDHEPVADGNLIGNSLSYNYETILWFKEIKTKIERFKKYPKAAREKNIQGEVLVDISISNDGYVSNINIFKSSGDKSLDDGAIKIIKSAQPFLPLMNLNQTKVSIRIPIKFSLK
ncbi:MAG: energy transducer TonB [Candidatus Firestonebacteria bacterium]